MRPSYESQEDIDNADAVVEKVQNAWGVTCRKLPHNYYSDYVAGLPGGREIEFMIEVKCRKTKSTDYDTYMISLNKYEKLINFRKTTGKGARLIVGFADKIMWVEAAWHEGCNVQLKGRTIQARDQYDCEPCAMIPMKYFKELSDGD